MRAREQLADVIGDAIEATDALDARACNLAAADAVLGMIKPLIWEDSYGVWRAATPFGDYKVTGRILTLPLPMNPQQVHADEESAKAAAYHHHRAQWLAALGLAAGEGQI